MEIAWQIYQKITQIINSQEFLQAFFYNRFYLILLVVFLTRLKYATYNSLYGANLVTYSPTARKKLKMVADLGYTHFPVCIAKTQYSFSTNPKLVNVPKNFELHVQDIVINAGAEMLVVVSGEIMRMPGLPKNPQALYIDIVNGQLEGLS